MRSYLQKSSGKRFLLPAAICAVAVLAGCGTAGRPVGPVTSGAQGSPATSGSPGTPAAGPSAPAPLPSASTPLPAPPETGTWRLLPAMPGARWGATAVWDGTEVLFIGGTRAGAPGPESDGVAFNPATGEWRRLPGMGYYNRWEFAAVWTGRQVLVWGGLTGTLQNPEIPPHGVAYDPAVNLYDWSAMPRAPLRGRGGPAAVWTGRQMIVWGGAIPGPQQNTLATDGAAYQPSKAVRTLAMLGKVSRAAMASGQ